MTTSMNSSVNKSTEIKRKNKPQKFTRAIVETSNKRYRLSTRRSGPDWDAFHQAMQSMIDDTRDPLYREHLRKLHNKIPIESSLEPAV